MADKPPAGPAHAVYFATYETVKHRLGGNEGEEHHPFAVGGNRPSPTSHSPQADIV